MTPKARVRSSHMRHAIQSSLNLTVRRSHVQQAVVARHSVGALHVHALLIAMTLKQNMYIKNAVRERD